MAYEHLGGATLDYHLCRYGRSKLLVRGPKVQLAPPYTLFLGGTETFGRFVPRPFPDLVGEALGITVVNLACINAGLDAFAEDPDLLKVIGGAETVVFQVIGAHNLSNRFYNVHPRRNDRFTGPTSALRRLYPDMDFTEISFTRHLLQSLERRGADRFPTIVAALQERWQAQMAKLTSAVLGRLVLLWLSDRPPPSDAGHLSGASDPLFIDAMMMTQLALKADHTLHVIPSAAARQAGLRGMVVSEFERHIAEETLGAAGHVEVAEALTPVLQGLRTAA